MELKRGYKQSEVGIIPEEWEVKPFTQVTDLITCGIAATPEYVAESGGYPFLSSTNVKDGRIVWSGYKHIGATLHRQLYRNNPPQKGDILYSRVGTFGEAAVVDVDFEFSVYVSLTLIKPGKSLDSFFLMQLLNSAAYKSRAKEQIYLGGGVGNLNVDIVRRYPILVPPLPEQRAIASALSDTDALIRSLDQLIAKKRDIKQAAMQQLLTGKRRLPGFSGEWETYNFGRIFSFLQSGNNARQDLTDHGEVGYIHYGDIHTQSSAFLECNSVKLPHIVLAKVFKLPLIEEGDLVMVDASEDYEGIGKSVEIKNLGDRKIVAGLHTFLLRADKCLLSNGFMGYLQYFPSVRTALVKLATGISVYGVSKNNVRAIEVSLPKRDEQAAIATVLSDMDAEITALEARREKTRLLKQGMMQELLTGRIRLV